MTGRHICPRKSVCRHDIFKKSPEFSLTLEHTWLVTYCAVHGTTNSKVVDAVWQQKGCMIPEPITVSH